MAEVSTHLTEVMVRTERLSSTIDHNGMLTTIHDPVGPPHTHGPLFSTSTAPVLPSHLSCSLSREHCRRFHISGKTYLERPDTVPTPRLIYTAISARHTLIQISP